MKSDTQKFIDCLEDAENLLVDHPVMGAPGFDHSLSYAPAEHFDLALFETWSDFCEPDIRQKPPIRIIQHQSCTGGTLISKCLAGMPNVALLSEVNPLSQVALNTKPSFNPTDLTYLAFRGNFPLIDELREKIFKSDIKVISKHTNSLGKYLVLREHSHSDFFMGEAPNKTRTLRKLLRDDHPILSVLTVRHPVDSYLSLVEHKWVHFTPGTFDEYCNRYLLFIDHNKNVPLHKYEDFVDDPDAVLRLICRDLELPFNEDFADVFDLNTLSGDSGRSSNVIEKRERRELLDTFQEEIDNSAKYQELVELLHYKV
jgi:hypothetical protein